MDKYYTPDISEFFVGFEFEKEIIDCNWSHKGWEKEIFTSDRILKTIETYPNLHRVKYLDKEDVESLGFKLKSKSIDLWFEREEIYLRDDGHHLKNIKLQYGLHDQRLKITFHYVSGEEQIHFEGIIKNKSELVKLLKQLQIG